MAWVARSFHRLLATIFLIAWGSLALQVKLLIGARGLLPVSEFLDRGHPSFLDFPTLFLVIPPSDAVLVGLAVLGAALGVAGMVTRWGRPLLALQLPLYLSYVVACRSFLGFQWDNLLLECALLGLFLPSDRPGRLAHLAFRLLLFKLYFESGIAKWQSHLHDWQDGSAMTSYYETAPLPTFLAAAAHHLPAWWHEIESRAVLVLELALPFAIFAPRRFRLGALVVFTAFQIVNLSTANYGFFCYLTLVLHIFLVADLPRPVEPAWRPPSANVAGAILLCAYGAVSTLESIVAFADPGHDVARAVEPVRRLYEPFRVIDTYHLFGSITRERIEPDFQTSVDGETFVGHDLHFKPGDPARRPPFVAPHQPRVDFLLWFYGLAYHGGTPEYVARLLDRLCHDPDAVAPLFVDSLPPAPKAVQIVFWDYHFGEGVWWTRTPRDTLGPVACAEVDFSGASRGAR